MLQHTLYAAYGVYHKRTEKFLAPCYNLSLEHHGKVTFCHLYTIVG